MQRRPTGGRFRTSAWRSSWRTAPTATSARSIEEARAALVQTRAGADAARALPARARHHRGARPRRRLQRDVRAAERRLARRRCAPSATQFLRDTQAMWDEVLPEFAKRVLGMTRDGGDARRRARAVPRARVRRVLPGRARWSRRSGGRCARWASIPTRGGRIRLDTGEREGKRSRAFCAPVRVPDEVYLVLRPHGGQTDWNTFLHELGHALHFAYMRPDLPFEYPLARRQLDHRRLRDAVRPPDAGRRVAAALHGARQADDCRRSCARRASRSCTSCVATARS